jgi:polar amino acid transport system substrate-binding protein
LIIRILILLPTLLCAMGSTLEAAPLRVGMVHEEPFSALDDGGTWQGVAVVLWTQAAKSANLDWTPVKVDSYSALIDGLSDGTLDVAVGGITVTPERAKRVDFLPAWDSTSIGVAVSAEVGLQFLTLIASLADSAFLGLSAVMLSLVLLFGVAVWLCERGQNNGEFGGEHHHGLGSGLWWSMVTMSTVGYGDKSPRTWAGRLIAGIWIVLALVLVSVFTGAAASAFTQRSSVSTSNVVDLQGRSIGALRGGETASWLRSKGLQVTPVDSSGEGMRRVAAGTLDAYAGDVPSLRWTQLDQNIDGLSIRSGLRPEWLAFAVRLGLEQEHKLNVAVLEAMQSAQWLSSLQAAGWPHSGLLR